MWHNLFDVARMATEVKAVQEWGPEATISDFRLDGVEVAGTPGEDACANVEVSCRVQKPLDTVVVKFSVE